MSNQEVLIAIQRGYRMEKPNYPGKTSPENMNAIYTVSTIGKHIISIYYRFLPCDVLPICFITLFMLDFIADANMLEC